MGTKMPTWIQDGSKHYLSLLNTWINVQCMEIPLLSRSKSSSLQAILKKEASALHQAIPHDAFLIALDARGKEYSSEDLAHRFAQFKNLSQHLCFIIGGPEGLASEFISAAQEIWSLSKLTLPHTLIRIIFIEAIYRSLSIIHHHPYHK